MRTRTLLVGTAITVISFSAIGCGETASSYCHGIYNDGGTTPVWAAKNGDFSNYSSCVDWYVYEKEQAGP